MILDFLMSLVVLDCLYFRKKNWGCGVDFFRCFKSWSFFPLSLSPEWMAAWGFCVGQDALAGLLTVWWVCAQALEALVLYSGWTILLLEALPFPRLFVPPVISSYLGFPLRVNARLPVICVEVGEADGSANQHSSRYRPSIIPTVFSPLLTSHSCPPSYLLAQSPEPSGVPGQIVSLDFLLAFQKAVWLPAPFRLPCGVFWAVAFPACLIH